MSDPLVETRMNIKREPISLDTSFDLTEENEKEEEEQNKGEESVHNNMLNQSGSVGDEHGTGGNGRARLILLRCQRRTLLRWWFGLTVCCVVKGNLHSLC